MAGRSALAGIALGVSLAISVGIARAPTGTIVHVDCNNTTGIEDGTPEHPYDTIQEGIDAAVDGDTVLVQPCTYYENIDFLGKAITVTGTDPLDPAIVDTTVIDGGGAGCVVTFDEGEGPNSVLTGFTITNGVAESGGGIHCLGSSPTISHNTITMNGALLRGGGIYCEDSAATISDNTISWNFGLTGAGIACRDSAPILAGNTIAGNWCEESGGGIVCYGSTPIISGNLIGGNVAEGPEGGGIACYESAASVVNNTIMDNSAESGSGVFCSDSSLVIEGNVIIGNGCQSPYGPAPVTAAQSQPGDPDTMGSWSGQAFSPAPSCVTPPPGEIFGGGGVCCRSSSGTISGNTITENCARRGAGILCVEDSMTVADNVIAWNMADMGGGIACVSSAATITQNTVEENWARVGGGLGCWVYRDWPADSECTTITNNTITGNIGVEAGGGVYCFWSWPTIAGNTISGNFAGERGGGVCCEDARPIVTGNTIIANTAQEGGGLGLFWCPDWVLVSNNILAENSASSGGGVHCWGELCVSIVNCTIAGNHADAGAGICYLSTMDYPLTVANSIVEGGISALEIDAITITYSAVCLDVLSPWPGEGNICADPQLDDQYHLLPASACVDAGTNEGAPPHDIDGDPRPWPPWATVDMGADECVLACECDVAIERRHCKLPAAGHVGQCKTGHIGARNLSVTESCDVVLRVIDDAGNVVFEATETIGPGRGIRVRFEHCYTADEVGGNLWTWEAWPADCGERTPWDNVYLGKVSVNPRGAGSAPSARLPLRRVNRR